VDNVAAYILVGFWLAISIGWFVICVLKGKIATAIFGCLFGVVQIVGAIRLAKPDSRWARGYTRRKMEAAKARYPKNADRVPADWVPKPDPLDEPAPRHEQDSDDEWSHMSDQELRLAATDPIVRRALKKSGRLPT
jgi:hypothetical protein